MGDKGEEFESNVLHLQKTGTLDRFTKYERAQVLGARTTQIQGGMPVITIKDGKPIIENNDPSKITNCIELAKEELLNGSTPIIVNRPLPSGEIVEIPVQKLI